ncbi:Starch-binding associating with outer membrane [Flavobacteriaceae bacterium MAR_2010_188]|nr:Starch-binding associating with outer membrane [Flavobacteriaceae bacterium MAR_2010_188]
MKNISLKIITSIVLFGFVVSSCTNLEIDETDSRISEGFQGIDDPNSAIEGLYGQVSGQYGDQANFFALGEVTTDAQLVPTRGTDWGDNGLWRVLHAHNWPVDHAFFNAVWNQFNSSQLRASQIIDERSSPTAVNVGEASLLRAYSMWVILDNFGQVPFRDTTLPSSSLPVVLTGQEAVDFILSDLDTAIANLPSVAARNVAENKGSKAAARFMKAKVLLNKHIYLGGTAESGDMNEVISLVDAIAGEGYALQGGYFDLFLETQDSETIWAFNQYNGNRIYNGLHYNSTSLNGGGWNGFSTLAEYYDMFEGDANSNRVDAAGNPLDGQEERRGGVPPSGTTPGSNVGYGFLVGQQFALDGTPLKDRAGAPLTFKRDFRDGNGDINFINNDETTGIRVIKYNPRDDASGAYNHEIIFRYSDAHLMKAEAMMRSGGDASGMVNELRVLREASPLGSVSELDLLAERGRELYVEVWRRNDMIRFGQFTRDWLFKDPTAIGNPDKNLFPIPPSQLLANPALVQNPGY